MAYSCHHKDTVYALVCMGGGDWGDGGVVVVGGGDGGGVGGTGGLC
jgi:hypothetical protein